MASRCQASDSGAATDPVIQPPGREPVPGGPVTGQVPRPVRSDQISKSVGGHQDLPAGGYEDGNGGYDSE